MRVVVRHGHFAFYPSAKDEVFRFQRIFKLRLVAEDNYYTFEDLIGLPRWSQVARAYGGLPALVNYEGRHAWEVMRENGFVYSLALSTLIPYSTVTETIALPQGLDYAVAPKPLIQPGCILSTGNIPGNVLLGYQGELDLSIQRLFIASLETLL